MDWIFSSRSNLKSLIKQLGIYINIGNILLFEIFCNKKLSENNRNKLEKTIEYIYSIRERLALLQHHDVITGTSFEKTSKDYEKIAEDSIKKLKQQINFLINILNNFYPFDICSNIISLFLLDTRKNYL